jgi:hypothetical protein
MTRPDKEVIAAPLDASEGKSAAQAPRLPNDPAAVLRSHTLDWTVGLSQEELRRAGIPEESIREFFFDRPED